MKTCLSSDEDRRCTICLGWRCGPAPVFWGRQQATPH